MSNQTTVQPPGNVEATSLTSTLDIRIFRQLVTILLAGVFIYGYRLGDSPLYRTEPFRALVAHQMVASHDWLVPRLYGEVYLRKPPLIYWIQATAEKLAGHGDEFVWRLPSALGSALLAVFLAWWAGRWFGQRARMPAGFSCLALVALWDQDRGADIDALNTAFAVLTTICVLEVIYGAGRSAAGWCAAFGFSLGATLLLKGPGGLPQVIAAVVGPAIALTDWTPARRRWKPILIGFLMGLAMFTAYAIAAKLQMRRLHLPPDQTGWYEVIEKVFLHGWISRLTAFVVPLQLAVFALPVSLVLPFAIAAVRRIPASDPHRQRAIAILGTLGAAVVIWLIDGNDNPRYEYVMLPLLAPLVGFVWTELDPANRWFRAATTGTGVLLYGTIAAVCIKLPRQLPDHAVLLAVLAVATVCLVALLLFSARAVAVRHAITQRGRMPAVVVLLLLLSIPMADRKNDERRRKSAKNPAAELRAVIGNADQVSAAGVVRDMPELFYYAGVKVKSFGEFGLPQLAADRGGHWVVIADIKSCPAYSKIIRHIPGAFPRGVIRLHMPNPVDVIYVGWYDPPASVDTHLDWSQVKASEPED